MPPLPKAADCATALAAVKVDVLSDGLTVVALVSLEAEVVVSVVVSVVVDVVDVAFVSAGAVVSAGAAEVSVGVVEGVVVVDSACPGIVDKRIEINKTLTVKNLIEKLLFIGAPVAGGINRANYFVLFGNIPQRDKHHTDLIPLRTDNLTYSGSQEHGRITQEAMN